MPPCFKIAALRVYTLCKLTDHPSGALEYITQLNGSIKIPVTFMKILYRIIKVINLSQFSRLPQCDHNDETQESGYETTFRGSPNALIQIKGHLSRLVPIIFYL